MGVGFGSVEAERFTAFSITTTAVSVGGNGFSVTALVFSMPTADAAAASVCAIDDGLATNTGACSADWVSSNDFRSIPEHPCRDASVSRRKIRRSYFSLIETHLCRKLSKSAFSVAQGRYFGICFVVVETAQTVL
jgi:hypothetical protein